MPRISIARLSLGPVLASLLLTTGCSTMNDWFGLRPERPDQTVQGSRHAPALNQQSAAPGVVVQSPYGNAPAPATMNMHAPTPMTAPAPAPVAASTPRPPVPSYEQPTPPLDLGTVFHSHLDGTPYTPPPRPMAQAQPAPVMLSAPQASPQQAMADRRPLPGNPAAPMADNGKLPPPPASAMAGHGTPDVMEVSARSKANAALPCTSDVHKKKHKKVHHHAPKKHAHKETAAVKKPASSQQSKNAPADKVQVADKKNYPALSDVPETPPEMQDVKSGKGVQQKSLEDSKSKADADRDALQKALFESAAPEGVTAPAPAAVPNSMLAAPPAAGALPSPPAAAAPGAPPALPLPPLPAPAAGAPAPSPAPAAGAPAAPAPAAPPAPNATGSTGGDSGLPPLMPPPPPPPSAPGASLEQPVNA